MPINPLQAEIGGQSVNLGVIADRVARQTDSLPDVFAGLRADKPKVKYGCLKVLRTISEKKPAVLYPAFDQFVDLLDSENNILKWGALIILGNLAAVDSNNKIDGILDRYLQSISGPIMITAANSIRGAGKIALAKPRLADKIASALRQVEAANYQTPECRNVALGHAVESLDLIFEHIRDPQPVVAFVERQLRNRRNAVKRKAAAFLKKHGRTPNQAIQRTETSRFAHR
jgi:hypothetical protein